MRAPIVEAAAWDLSPGQQVIVKTGAGYPVTVYTRFLLEHMPDLSGRAVLDFGAGSGIIGIAASLLGASSVVACDVSGEALRLTKENADLNNATNVRTLLVAPGEESREMLQESADVILCNPASLPQACGGEAYWSGGQDGTRMIKALVQTAASALRPKGLVRYVHTSLAPLHPLLQAFEEQGFAVGILQVKRVPFRHFYEPLLAHLLQLRERGSIFFDGSTLADSYEYLYIIEARRPLRDCER